MTDKKINKVLVVAQGLCGGGAEKFLKNLVEINHKNAIKTAVCSPENTTHLAPFFETYGVKFYQTYLVENGNAMTYNFFGKTIKLPFVENLFAVYELLSILKAFFLFRPHLIVISNTLPASLFGVFLCFVPTILFVHSLPNYYLTPNKRHFVRLITSKLFRNKFVTVSAYSNKMIEKFWCIPLRKQQTVPNGVKIQAENSFEKRENIILTVGDFIGYKNPETWFEVAKIFVRKYPTYKFVWVGKDHLNNQFQERIRAENLSHQLIIAGHSSEIATCYLKSKIYFHPSFLESQGISILEAMSFGLPCVASCVGGIPESVIAEETGFLAEPKDINNFVNYLEKLHLDNELYKKMSASSFQRIKDCFSFAKNEQNIMAMYQWAFKSNK